MHRRKKKSKYEQDALLITSEVIEIIENNKQYPNEKIKNVFKCASRDGNGKTCIYWGISNIATGDEISMTGRYKDEVFLVWSLQIIKKGTNKNVKNSN